MRNGAFRISVQDFLIFKSVCIKLVLSGINFCNVKPGSCIIMIKGKIFVS